MHSGSSPAWTTSPETTFGPGRQTAPRDCPAHASVTSRYSSSVRFRARRIGRSGSWVPAQEWGEDGAGCAAETHREGPRAADSTSVAGSCAGVVPRSTTPTTGSTCAPRARGGGPPNSNCAPAKNPIHPVQAACEYSWRIPASLSRRCMFRSAMRSGSVIGVEAASSGACTVPELSTRP
ncbi:MAG: hypothetical protein JWR58_5018 [Pseudonocardia sp.]|nr:hypothetical protein [Pseudonocardia sp.]